MQARRVAGRRFGNDPNPVTEFAGGVGEGLYDVGEGTVAGIHSALTTNPATTVRNVGREIASMIDSAIAAEDTPARIRCPVRQTPSLTPPRGTSVALRGWLLGTLRWERRRARHSPGLPQCADFAR